MSRQKHFLYIGDVHQYFMVRFENVCNIIQLLLPEQNYMNLHEVQ